MLFTTHSLSAGITQMLVSAVITLLGGAVGAWWCWGYLFVLLRVRSAPNEARFVAAESRTTRNGCASRIDAAGELTIHAIGARLACRAR